jgi:hypothetical protein
LSHTGFRCIRFSAAVLSGLLLPFSAGAGELVSVQTADRGFFCSENEFITVAKSPENAATEGERQDSLEMKQGLFWLKGLTLY